MTVIDNMGKAIRTRLIKIGHSQGVRIPKSFLEETGIQVDVEIEVQGDHLTIRAAPPSRDGWDEAFSTATQAEHLLLAQVRSTDWDNAEWEW